MCRMQLHLGHWGDAPDGLGNAGKPLEGGDQQILDPAVLEFGQNAEPELRALGLADPEPEEFLIPERSGPAPSTRRGFARGLRGFTRMAARQMICWTASNGLACHAFTSTVA